MKNILLIVLLSTPSFIFAQNSIRGIITEANTNKPIPSATVYINGTTKGTYTDDEGHFSIDNPSFPCLLVISHIGYETKTQMIANTSSIPISFAMQKSQHNISQVVVKGKNQREKNIKTFKEQFLGTDKYGENAVIKNDRVLIFSHSTDSIMLDNGKFRKGKGLNVSVKSPLIIEFPLLGYLVRVDLVEFSTCRFSAFSTRSKHLGYFFYKELDSDNPQKTIKYKKERQKVYYNSSMHFLRSLYNNILKNNGYLILKREEDKESGKAFYSYYDFSLTKEENGQKQIEGLENQKLIIHYFSKGKKPVDLESAAKDAITEDDRKKVWNKYLIKKDRENLSRIFFLSDTCYISASGIIPDNNIMFDGYISKNKTGSLLPEDYYPE